MQIVAGDTVSAKRQQARTPPEVQVQARAACPAPRMHRPSVYRAMVVAGFSAQTRLALMDTVLPNTRQRFPSMGSGADFSTVRARKTTTTLVQQNRSADLQVLHACLRARDALWPFQNWQESRTRGWCGDGCNNQQEQRGNTHRRHDASCTFAGCTERAARHVVGPPQHQPTWCMLRIHVTDSRVPIIVCSSAVQEVTHTFLTPRGSR